MYPLTVERCHSQVYKNLTSKPSYKKHHTILAGLYIHIHTLHRHTTPTHTTPTHKIDTNTHQFLAGLHVALSARDDGLDHGTSFVGEEVHLVDDQQGHQRAQGLVAACVFVWIDEGE